MGWLNRYVSEGNKCFLYIYKNSYSTEPVKVLIDKDAIVSLRYRTWKLSYSGNTLSTIRTYYNNENIALSTYLRKVYCCDSKKKYSPLDFSKKVIDCRKSTLLDKLSDNRILLPNKVSVKNRKGYRVVYYTDGAKKSKSFFETVNRSIGKCKELACSFYIEKKLEFIL